MLGVQGPEGGRVKWGVFKQGAKEAGLKAGGFVAKKGLAALLAPSAGPAAPLIANAGVDFAIKAMNHGHDGGGQPASSVYTGGDLNYFNA